jgi:hypothetical protein
MFAVHAGHQFRGVFQANKGRGSRVVDTDTLQGVTPDAKQKIHFVIVDSIGVCEQDKNADATRVAMPEGWHWKRRTVQCPGERYYCDMRRLSDGAASVCDASWTHGAHRKNATKGLEMSV